MVTLLQTILLIIVAFLGIPIGKIIAKNTKEELKKGRKWFTAISGACLLMLAADLILLAFKSITIDTSIMFFAIFTFIFLMTIQGMRAK